MEVLKKNLRDFWVAQLVNCPTLAQVMISRFISFSPVWSWTVQEYWCRYYFWVMVMERRKLWRRAQEIYTEAFLIIRWLLSCTCAGRHSTQGQRRKNCWEKNYCQEAVNWTTHKWLGPSTFYPAIMARPYLILWALSRDPKSLQLNHMVMCSCRIKAMVEWF